MRPYGLPREAMSKYLDCGDIREFARASAHGHISKHGGPCRSNFKNSAAKRTTRRYFKKTARRAAKADLVLQMADA